MLTPLFQPKCGSRPLLLHILNSPLIVSVLITRLGHALITLHVMNKMRYAHVLLHCRLQISSLQIYVIIMAIIYIVGFITVYIYGKTSSVSHTRLEIVCYNVNIANK